MSIFSDMEKVSKNDGWPRFVRSGAVVVKVYRRLRMVDGESVEEFTIYFRLAGKDHRIYRSSLKAALTLAKEKAQEIERGEVDTITLAGADCAAYRNVSEMLGEEGLSFEIAVRDLI